MREQAQEHVPVLAEEVLTWLDPQPDGVYVDCTAGAAGHASLIAARLDGGKLLALDRDPKAVGMATARLAEFGCAKVLHRNYADLVSVVRELNWTGVDGVLIDAGCSSMQLDRSERGFSFQEEGPLDMRMDTSCGESAQEFLNTKTEAELAELLRDYGDVRPAKRVAKAILRRRDEGKLETTQDLVAAVEEALDFVSGVPSEVRTVFQALRIAVNRELEWLEQGLLAAIEVLRPGGRLVAIAFHSTEDRVVKRVLRETSRKQRLRQADGRDRETVLPRMRILTRRPVTPGDEELYKNRRAASAKLRAAERLSDS